MDSSHLPPRGGIRYEISASDSVMDFLHGSRKKIVEVAVPELLVFINSAGIHRAKDVDSLKIRIPDELESKIVFSEEEWKFLQDFTAKEEPLLTRLRIEKSFF